MLIFPIFTFANIHNTIPAGAATDTALPNTNSVLSNIDLIIIFFTCGFLYGGNSKIKLELSPLSKVFDKNFDIIKVNIIPSNTTTKTDIVDISEFLKLNPIPDIKIVDIVIKNGNLPLQGTKALVKIAISLSLFD